MGRRQRRDGGERGTRPPLDPRQTAALDELYAELPTIECRGACWDSCTSIQMTPVERRRINLAGVDIPDGREARGRAVCPALTMLHQCAVHAVRPLICRLWGLWASLPCTFGCRPVDGQLLDDEQAYEFMARVHDIAGEHAEAELIRRPWRTNPDKAREVMAAFHAEMRDEDLRRDVRRQQLLESGAPVLYVRGRGQVSSTPPAGGANAF